MKSIMGGDKPAKDPKKRELWADRRSGNNKSFGRASTKGGLSYLKGGERDGSPVNEGSGPMEDDAKSDRMESSEFGSEGLKDNLGSKRKSGYGDPQGGTTTTTSMPGGDKGDLMDETRGTHLFPKHPMAAKHDVPQEAKERMARALAAGRMRRG